MITHTLQFHVPPFYQGHLLEIAFAATDDGHVIRRRYDHTDRSRDYAIGAQLAEDQGDYWNGEPANEDWRAMTSAEMKRYGLN
jgi:hypothetical protein